MGNWCRLAIVTSVVVKYVLCSAPPLRVTIDCGSDENPREYSNYRSAELIRSNTRFDVNSFCNMIHQAIPKAIEDGKFVLVESDLASAGDTQSPVAVVPPGGFIPKLLGLPTKKISRIPIPRLPVPKLKPVNVRTTPKLGTPLTFSLLKESDEEQSSAERMEMFKKGVQKMLHFVKVLGQIDHYISERTRIIVDKLSKTFMD